MLVNHWSKNALLRNSPGESNGALCAGLPEAGGVDAHGVPAGAVGAHLPVCAGMSNGHRGGRHAHLVAAVREGRARHADRKHRRGPGAGRESTAGHTGTSLA